MWPGRRRAETYATGESLEIARGGGRGGAFATIISAFALIFSGFSFYESVLKAPRLSIYVPPQIAYIDPDRPDSPFEVFILPVTLANDGAQTGTVLSVELKVTNPRTSQSKRFYAAHFGAWEAKPSSSRPFTQVASSVRPFAPISLSGRDSFSNAIQFFPRVGEKPPRIMDISPGDYQFEISVNMVAAGKSIWPGLQPAKPLQFRMQAGQMDYRNFTSGRTMQLWSPDYQPAATR